jgi:hypothetical protein
MTTFLAVQEPFRAAKWTLGVPILTHRRGTRTTDTLIANRTWIADLFNVHGIITNRTFHLLRVSSEFKLAYFDRGVLHRQ